MTIALPTTPDGDQYEDLVCGLLRVQGYFVEGQLTLREQSKEVLELDAVATPLGAGSSERILFEAKKDGFHFENIFKLYGQRLYLGIPTARLVSLRSTDPQFLSVYQTKGEELGVSVCHFPLDGDCDVLAAPKNTLPNEQRSRLSAMAWYQQIARRIAIAALSRECNLRKGVTACDDARNYLFNVRASYFQGTPLARAEALYSAYFAHERLSGDALSLAAAEKNMPADMTAWGRVNDGSDWLWVQAIMYLESAARLTIVKNALDDFLERGAAAPPQTTLKLGSLLLHVPLHSLPASFNCGLARLRAHPLSLHIPYLFPLLSGCCVRPLP